MFKHLRDAHARRKGEEVVESGFTLIELLVVIVVLGILAATVVFALSGVTGQSAQAACNSDAKTIEVGVQAYINSPDNTTNATPTTVGQLVTAGFNKTGDPLVSGTGDTFLEAPPTNNAYAISPRRHQWRPGHGHANGWYASCVRRPDGYSGYRVLRSFVGIPYKL